MDLAGLQQGKARVHELAGSLVSNSGVLSNTTSNPCSSEENSGSGSHEASISSIIRGMPSPCSRMMPSSDRTREKLQQILGHSSVTVTERYAHLSPEMFNKADLAALAVDLGEPLVLPIKTREGGQKG